MEVGIQINTSRAVARFGAMPNKLRQALYKKITALTLELQRYIQTEKLQGQVLNKITGNLQSSVFSETTITNDGVEGRVYVGADVPYAAIHEYGGIIHHPGGTPYFIGKDGQPVFVSKETALGARLPVTKPHDIPMPERSYMRSGFQDFRDRIVQGLTDAAKEGMGDA